MAAVPFWPSLVAVIVAEPATLPVTSPVPVTVATDVLLLAHVTERPVRMLPLASRRVALSCTVWPAGTLADAGLTVTDATGTPLTVMLAVPLCPSLVAVIVTGPPAATPLTSPLPFTLAIALLLDCQVITRPVNGLPLASRGVAVSCTVCPIATVPELGVTVTAATGASVTVTVAVPLCPSLVAVIVTGPPAATPLTSPLPFTLAIALLLDCQVTTRPVNGLPFASLGVAVSCTVLPTATPAVAGVTVTDATGTGVTVMAAVPLWPSLVTVIVAEPATLVVTSPLLLTVATVVLFEAHVTVRPVKTLPFASLRVAVSCTVWPAGTLAEGGVTVTEATGAPATVMLAVPLWPSLVAVMVTDPAVTPVTSPLPLTVAMLLLLDDQLMARPVNGLPLASRGVAVSCTVPVIAMFAALGDTVTAATGATVTVTVAVPLWPSLVAVIVTGPPAATPLTSPLPFTVAIVVSLDCQVMTRPVNGLPFASRGVAVSCTVCPCSTLTERS